MPAQAPLTQGIVYYVLDASRLASFAGVPFDPDPVLESLRIPRVEQRWFTHLHGDQVEAERAR